jgi:hypothetical protein
VLIKNYVGEVTVGQMSVSQKLFGHDFQREDFYGTSSLLVGFKPLVSGLCVKCSATALLKYFKPSQNSNFEVLVSLYVVKQKFEVYIHLQCCPLYHTITKNMQFH